ncbi:MAG TPA: single-stranded-DNA-specific exonuclease RecJ [Methylophilaceae bacterium]|nr:single-stranded-DNA-specific exonuclease RecJ [Methylophilaceae bacterium]HQR60720.1 single-stranded-DNA-specific exonuclease RecJ [Methylophilaceae bacterium]
MVSIVTRDYPAQAAEDLQRAGCHPVLAHVLAARGITSMQQLECAPAGLIPPQRLTHAERMAGILADAIAQQKRLLIVADYDADGATACAVGVRGLGMFGAQVDYLVPNRFEFGYGLTPEIVALAAQRQPDFIITVDNGIASVEGVRAANAHGIAVLVTDHHLPGDELPDAACIINPNQPGCSFPSKHLAGVGVMFYLLLALRAELRKRGAYASAPEPNLTELLDLVALGTVADLVRLDENNRILVEQGLRRIRAGKASSGINALLRVAGRDPRRVCAQDMGFGVAPRLNAAGRLQDMALGIDCLLSSDEDEALRMAQRLDTLNRERRDIEADMHESALAALEDFDPGERYSLSLYQDDWHQGVIGILASRLKERFHRPTIVFAPAGEGMLKGSGRSITGLHLRDALDLVSKRHPGLLLRFGGHAMAAGLTIAGHDLERFTEALESVVRDLLTPADLECVIETDGAIDAADFGLELAEVLEHQVWGQGFAAPEFDDRFTVTEQRIVGERHLKLKLEKSGRPVNAILFNCSDLLPAKIRAVYRPQVNDYNGNRSLQLVVRYWEGC